MLYSFITNAVDLPPDDPTPSTPAAPQASRPVVSQTVLCKDYSPIISELAQRLVNGGTLTEAEIAALRNRIATLEDGLVVSDRLYAVGTTDTDTCNIQFDVGGYSSVDPLTNLSYTVPSRLMLTCESQGLQSSIRIDNVAIHLNDNVIIPGILELGAVQDVGFELNDLIQKVKVLQIESDLGVAADAAETAAEAYLLANAYLKAKNYMKLPDDEETDSMTTDLNPLFLKPSGIFDQIDAATGNHVPVTVPRGRVGVQNKFPLYTLDGLGSFNWVPDPKDPADEFTATPKARFASSVEQRDAQGVTTNPNVGCVYMGNNALITVDGTLNNKGVVCDTVTCSTLSGISPSQLLHIAQAPAKDHRGDIAAVKRAIFKLKRESFMPVVQKDFTPDIVYTRQLLQQVDRQSLKNQHTLVKDHVPTITQLRQDVYSLKLAKSAQKPVLSKDYSQRIAATNARITAVQRLLKPQLTKDWSQQISALKSRPVSTTSKISLSKSYDADLARLKQITTSNSAKLKVQRTLPAPDYSRRLAALSSAIIANSGRLRAPQKIVFPDVSRRLAALASSVYSNTNKLQSAARCLVPNFGPKIAAVANRVTGLKRLLKTPVLSDVSWSKVVTLYQRSNAQLSAAPVSTVYGPISVNPNFAVSVTWNIGYFNQRCNAELLASVRDNSNNPTGDADNSTVSIFIDYSNNSKSGASTGTQGVRVHSSDDYESGSSTDYIMEVFISDYDTATAQHNVYVRYGGDQTSAVPATLPDVLLFSLRVTDRSIDAGKYYPISPVVVSSLPVNTTEFSGCSSSFGGALQVLGDIRPQSNLVLGDSLTAKPTAIKLGLNSNVYSTFSNTGQVTPSGTTPVYMGTQFANLRFRQTDNANDGFVFENSSDKILVNLNANSGNMTVAGSVTAASTTIGGVNQPIIEIKNQSAFTHTGDRNQAVGSNTTYLPFVFAVKALGTSLTVVVEGCTSVVSGNNVNGYVNYALYASDTSVTPVAYQASLSGTTAKGPLPGATYNGYTALNAPGDFTAIKGRTYNIGVYMSPTADNGMTAWFEYRLATVYHR